ncbi:MAG: rRNA pseudouridine synthase [Bacilli bacterium]|nr:rRNA pseudouridine synthase [Bacilli bacterium]
MERLQKVIANSGFCSRRKAEEFIKEGKVKVNGKVITELGTKVEYSDDIMVNNTHITKEEQKVYYLLNKPRGVISTTSDDKNRKSIVDLINTDKRIYPIGRLDYDTTGLIILTNDGELANILMHPKNECSKTYVAKLEGILSKEDILAIKKGIVIDNRKVDIVNFKVRKKDMLKNTTLVEITINEGRNHIVKRLFSSLKHEVIKLTRTSYSFLTLDGLKSGDYRNLSIKEVKKLYSLKK